MRKITLIFLAGLFIQSVQAQTEFEKLAAKSICDCLNEMKTFDNEKFVGCFEAAMLENPSMVEAEMSKQGYELTEEEGRKYGQKFFEKISIDLIHQCPAYATILENARNSSIETYDNDSLKNRLVELEKIPKADRTFEIYTDNGLCNFLLGKYHEAVAAFDIAIAKNDSASQALFFKAWAFEKMKKYDEAISLYNIAILITGNQHIKIYVALAETKKKAGNQVK